MDARASAKYLRGSPQKARLVVDMIRGKNVNEALAVLQYTNKRAADGIEKCLRSAVANATEAAEKANIAVDPDDLWVKACFIDMGPTKNRRRMRPAPQGRAYKERRHFHHVTVLLSSDEQEAVKGKRPSKAGKPQTTKPGKKLAAKTAAAPKAAAKRAATKKPETAATDAPAAETTTATTGGETATAE
ncbi:MAG TPA: 50S ribosomal protein L22 [Pyrinomonadaceae bacterium]|nr:50S ribosomal protein L22 [Pyrinomonadaceae bacterium]